MKKILADIGNSSIGFLYFGQNGKRIAVKSFDYHLFLKQAKEILAAVGSEKTVVYVSSVNSKKAKSLVKIFSARPNIEVQILEPLKLKEKVRTLGYLIPNLAILGSDLLFDILSCPPSSLLADYGTASKILAVDRDKVFLGGMIGPGLNVLNKSLFNSTELLGDYVVEMPHGYLSYDTKEAINASTVYGEAMKLMGIYAKFKADLADPAFRFYLTGGDGEILAQALNNMNFADFVFDPLALFKGMAKALDIYEEFFQKGE
jgi:pantothenate kinase type III